MLSLFSVQAKRGLHTFIDIAMPRNDVIAALAFGVGYWWRVSCQANIPGSILDKICGTSSYGLYNNLCRYGYGPFFSESITPNFCEYTSVGGAVVTSVTLNMIARIFFGAKKASLEEKKSEQTPPPQKPVISEPKESSPLSLSVLEKKKKLNQVKLDLTDEHDEELEKRLSSWRFCTAQQGIRV